jgi:hypothetical protein
VQVGCLSDLLVVFSLHPLLCWVCGVCVALATEGQWLKGLVSVCG